MSLQNSHLKPISHIGPVTASSFINKDILLIGSGPCIYVYNWKTRLLLFKQRIFTRNKIHGIHNRNNKIFLWGGNNYAVCELVCTINSEDDEKSDIKINQLISEKNLDDWIYSIDLFNENHLCILTAHNNIRLIDFSVIPSSSKCIINVEENSLLYSGDIFIENNAGNPVIYVVSGTIFGPIIVWSYSNGETKMIQKLIGHEGSIFSVKFSFDHSKIVSCSDDRSIRLWDINSNKCLAIGWGHQARIWDLQFYDKNTIISCSEDSTTRLWTWDENANSKLINKFTWNGHFGKHIWCVSLNISANVLASGGGDGRVCIWNIKDSNIATKSPLLALVNNNDSNSKISFKSHACFSNGIIVATTSTGDVYLYTTFKDFSMIYHSDRLKGNNSIDVWPDSSYCIIADSSGSILILDVYSATVLFDFTMSYPGKQNVICFNNETNLFLLVQSCEASVASFYAFNNENSNLKMLFHTDNFTLPNSFTTYSMYVDENLNNIVLGSRQGSISVYKFSKQGIINKPPMYLKRILGSESTITSITQYPGSVLNQKDNTFLLFTGRNSKYCCFLFSNDNIQDKSDNCSDELLKIHSNFLQDGTIEGALFYKNELLLFGFKKDLFFIWNETRQYFILQEICGGIHRRWNFITSNEGNFTFVYTKTSQIYILNGDLNFKNCPILKPGTHCREIRDIQFNPIKLKDGSRLFATASEDTTIILSKLDSFGSIKYLHRFRCHVSGIQRLQWSSNGKFLFSCGAREELFVWQVYDFNSQIFMNLVSIAPTITENVDMRIMDIDITPIKSKNNEQTSDFFIVSSVLSDSTINLLIYNVAEKKFFRFLTGRYNTKCILNVELICSFSEVILLISTSDGYITGWNIKKVLYECGLQAVNGEIFRIDDKLLPTNIKNIDDGLKTSLQVHQSGVKSILLSPAAQKKNEFLLFSGGDDNAIKVCKLSLCDNGMNLEVENSVLDAHSSCITGITRFQDNIVSFGVDQRIKVWKYNENGLKNIEEVYSTVADIGCGDMNTVNENPYLIIGGLGLSCFGMVENL